MLMARFQLKLSCEATAGLLAHESRISESDQTLQETKTKLLLSMSGLQRFVATASNFCGDGSLHAAG